MKPPRILAPACVGLLASLVLPAFLHAQELDAPPTLPAPPAEATPAPPPPAATPAPPEADPQDELDPRTGERIHRPPGYAPAQPQPFLRGPPLYLAQFVAGLGARGLVGVFGFVPCLGLFTQVVSPGAEALSVLLAGDRLGPYRSSLLWPLVASYVASGITLALSVVLSLVGMVVTTLGSALLTPAAMGWVPWPFLALSLGVLGTGLVVLLAGTAVGTLGNSVVSPLASVVAYHLSRRPKRLADNGTGLPLLLPREKGPRVPFINPRPPAPDDDGDCDERGALPVSAPGVQP